MFTDADLEMRDLTDAAYEEDAETCRQCGQVGQSITVKAPTRADRVQVYECACGHFTSWDARGRRRRGRPAMTAPRVAITFTDEDELATLLAIVEHDGHPALIAKAEDALTRLRIQAAR